MFHRNLIAAVCALSMLSLAAGASAAPAPQTGDALVDETVATSYTYASRETSQWVAFVTRGASLIFAATETTGEDADATTSAIATAATTAQTAIASAIVEGDTAALQLAVDDFQSGVSVAALQFQADTGAQVGDFGGQTAFEAQLFAVEQRDVSFGFADSMRSVTAAYGTEDVRVVTSMAEFLTFVAFGSSADLSEIVFHDVATDSFVIINGAATSNVQDTMGSTTDLTLEGLLAASDFRANRLQDVGETATVAQDGVRGALTAVTGTGSQVGTTHQNVNAALKTARDTATGMDVETVRGTATGALLDVSGQASGGAAGAIDMAGSTARGQMDSGASSVFEILRS